MRCIFCVVVCMEIAGFAPDRLHLVKSWKVCVPHTNANDSVSESAPESKHSCLLFLTRRLKHEGMLMRPPFFSERLRNIPLYALLFKHPHRHHSH